IALPRGAMVTTRSFGSSLIAWPSRLSLRVMAGRTVWKKRRCSRRPPLSRTVSIGLLCPPRSWCSTTHEKPNVSRHFLTQAIISGSVLFNLQTVWLKLPSASKIPARNPAHQSAVSLAGHAISARIESVFGLGYVEIGYDDL